MISVIIPVLNEVFRLPSLLKSLESSPVKKEIIVVDGGSTDGSWQIANRRALSQHSLQVMRSEAGRGIQLQAGVSQSKGDILFFLHADSRIKPQVLHSIRETMDSSPHLIGGNFPIVFEGNRLFYNFMNVFYGLIRHFGIYYGDSGIFVRRSVYNAIGGLSALPIMEDYDLVRRMEHYGKTTCISTLPLVTSTRRFEHKNALQMFYLWGKMHLLYRLGVEGRALHNHYNGFLHDAHP